MKRIAVINDMSGFGRCSLVAAISVLSAMGIQACPLPTAILSAQTGFQGYFLDDYTEKMPKIRASWEAMDIVFDGIYTGFVSDVSQLAEIVKFVEIFRRKETFLLVDPIMGDHGVTYEIFSSQLLEQMRDLSRSADMITPNLTELCLLCNEDYGDITSPSSPYMLPEKVRNLAAAFSQDGPREIIVTGIPLKNPKGEQLIGNYYYTPHHDSFHTFPYIGGGYSGTGDLFASCICGGKALSLPMTEVITAAGDFLVASIRDAVQNHTPCRHGVLYEKNLHMMMNLM